MSDEAPPRRKPVLDKDTLIPIGVVTGIVFGAIGIHAWLTGQFSSLKEMIRSVENRVVRMEEKYDGRGQDRWTGTDMKLWASELRRANPALVVPDAVHYEPK